MPPTFQALFQAPYPQETSTLRFSRWMNEEAEGNLQGKRKRKIAIPQRYQELDLGGSGGWGKRGARLGGGPSLSLTLEPSLMISQPPRAAGRLLPPTQRPHFRANGLHHEVRRTPDNSAVEARAPRTNFLHACFRANLNLKGARRKGTKSIKEEQRRN